MFNGCDEEVDSSHVDDCSSSLPLVDVLGLYALLAYLVVVS